MNRVIVAIWSVFVLLLVYGAVSQWMSNDIEDDSGGPCACVAFSLFLILLLMTKLLRMLEQRNAQRRGFEVLPPDAKSDADSDIKAR